MVCSFIYNAVESTFVGREDVSNFVVDEAFFSSFTSKGIRKRNWQYEQND